MNFLAHLFLSYHDEDLLIGNMIADFIKNREVKNFIEGVQKGIYMHRAIDSFTDKHLIVRKATKRLQPYHRKYAPVVIDLYYDYFLSQHWATFSEIPFEDFTSNCYQILERRMEEIPERLKKRLPNMIADHFLSKYGSYEGLQFVFSIMDRRTTFPSNFSSAIEQLDRYHNIFEEEFLKFFPEIIEYVGQLEL